MERNSKKNFIIDVLYAVLVIGLVLGVSYAVFKFLLPFVMGVIVALCVQKPAIKISEKTVFSKGTASALLSFLLYLAAAALVCFFAYRIILSALGFTDYLPQFFKTVGEKINGIGAKYSHFFERIPEEMRLWIKSLISETVQNIVGSVGNWVTAAISGFIKKMPQFFISGIVTLVASCYIAKDFEHLKRFAKTTVGEAVAGRTVKVKNILVGSVFKMIKGYFILSLITCVQLYIGFLILKIEKPFTLAVLIALIDLLPVLGTGTIMLPWALVNTLSGNYGFGIGIGVLYIITVVVRNFSEPKIIGKQLGVDSLFTLIAMFLGLKVLGFWGLILFPIVFIVVVQYYKGEMNDSLSV